jgi:hypothetical protein
MQRFAAAPADADKRILDISGDGSNNSGRPVTEARDEALATGITINGLVIIETRPTPDFRTHNQLSGGLGKYFESNVIGGPGAFLLQVENFDTFAEAMVRKLVAEIARLPKARPDENKRLTHKMLAGHFEERPAWQRPR